MPVFNAASKINALLYPLSALAYYFGDKEKLHEKIILRSAEKLFNPNSNKQRWEKALLEIRTNDFIPPNKSKDGEQIAGNAINTLLGKWLYCLIRALQPKTLIETGIAHGNSSYVLLNALHKNGEGHLYSLDLPNRDTDKNYNFDVNTRTGWLVPELLRKHWTMIIGDSTKTLPDLLAELKEIDFFFHDSNHSYEHMRFEFDTIFPFVVKNGIISSDDINKNKAFKEFISYNNLTGIVFTKGGSAIKR